MYGWDSFFESLGLLSDGNGQLAKAMVDNFVSCSLISGLSNQLLWKDPKRQSIILSHAISASVFH
jgi:hypothetical protein